MSEQKSDTEKEISPSIESEHLYQDGDNVYPVVFEYRQAEEAKSIGVTGSFNNWGSPVLLSKQIVPTTEGYQQLHVYAVTLYLPIGTHFFKYIVDGHWKYDPDIAFAPDTYGNLNNFITLSNDSCKVNPITGKKVIQRPMASIIRSLDDQLAQMNPIATKELMKVRQLRSPVFNAMTAPLRGKSTPFSLGIKTSSPSKLAMSDSSKDVFDKYTVEIANADNPIRSKSHSVFEMYHNGVNSAPQSAINSPVLGHAVGADVPPPPLQLHSDSLTSDLDSEYGINVDNVKNVGTTTGTHTVLGHHTYDKSVQSYRHHSKRSIKPTLTRSRSDESSEFSHINDLSLEDLTTSGSPKSYSRNNSGKGEAHTSSVLLAAMTSHFGGDLVTYEHATRAKKGGHRSLVTGPHISEKLTNSISRRKGKLILFLVGLPGRGKTFIGNIMARHLTWMGHQSKVFNTGEYRRKIVGSNLSHAFWDPKNTESVALRNQICQQCLEDSLAALESDSCDCVIYDATNVTIARRKFLREVVHIRHQCEMMFIESICDDPELIASSINEMKLNSADYAGQTMEETTEDYCNRIRHYQELYEPLSVETDPVPFIKVIDVGRQIFCNQVYGYLQSRIMFLMANLQLKPRPIWLSRHGESMYNTQKRIGGDSPLSPLGQQYAMQLDRFIAAYYPTENTQLAVWTSTMLRTGMTVERIAARGRAIVKWKQLDEIDAGICDGMTYEQVAKDMPEEYLARKNNKLHYRYPRGESYQDVIHRLEPVITELMRSDSPVLIVAHQAILRVLYTYLTNRSPTDCPTVNIPLHVVIQLTPKAYTCEEVWHRPM